MPRPGPRPYECVRRAWHSDRHHPIRGSLIQEIFRLANDVHDPATLKNKEWLEKLPLVVLKVEEVIYSKANSEAEYMDLSTLWDRANDAIDTIIRKDDAPETDGDLLQPCIEAALNLGCIPRRASRSQRHNHPGCYLSSVNKEAQHLVSSAAHLLQPLPLPSPHSSSNQQHSSFSRLESWYAAILAANKPNSRGGNEVNSVVPDGSLEPKYSNPSKDSLLHCHDGGAYSCPSLGRVYPLYYGADQPKTQDPAGSIPSVRDDGMDLLCNFTGSYNTKGVLDTGGLIFGGASKYATDGECDLSLRLGLFSPQIPETAWTNEVVEDVGSSSSCNGSKHCDPSPGVTRTGNFGTYLSSSSKDKGFDFINIDSSDEPFESFSSKWSSDEEGIFGIRHGL